MTNKYGLVPAILVAAFALIILCAWSTPATAQTMTMEGLVELYNKLKTPAVDADSYLDVTGKTLEQEDLVVQFEEGFVHPVKRSDGKIVGLVFSGKGVMTFSPADEHEQHQLTKLLGVSPATGSFASAFILCTDDTIDQLLGEEGEWAAGGGAPLKAKTIFDARFGLYSDPMWDDYGPSLEMDVLHDLFGDGYQGGYIYAEFAVEPTRWLSYYRNPRGALFKGEEICLFSHALHGGAPQYMTIYSSYASASDSIDRSAGRPYDLASVDIVVDVPQGGGERNLSKVEFATELKLAGLVDGNGSLAFRLQSRRPKCKGDTEWGYFKISSVRDYADELVPSIHDRNQLFVVMRAPMNRGEMEILKVNYGGELLEPVGGASSTSAYFSAFQDMPWYPRPLWTDRHALNTTVNAPRYITGVGTGNLEEQIDTKKSRTMIFKEAGGVLNGMLAIGEYQLTEGEQDGVRVQIFTSQQQLQGAKDVMTQAKTMLKYYGQLWGPFPYSSMTWVDLPALPAGNWNVESTDSVLYASEAGWTCSPPGQLYAWEGFAVSNTGCMSFLAPATAPAATELEERAINYFFMETPEAQAYYTASVMARQWWGQFISPDNYRDRWIVEAAVMISAAMYVGTYVDPDAYKRRIEYWHQMAVREEDAGALVTGERLEADFAQVVMGKGPAVMQMMIDTMGGDPYVNMMRSVMNRSPKEGVTNELFQQVFGEYMGQQKAEQFWKTWVVGSEIPSLRYSAEVVEEEGGTYKIVGKLVFDGVVPDNPIPLEIKYSAKSSDSKYKLITPEGPETEFLFEGLEKKPKKLLIDPDNLILLRNRKPLKE